jgi:hypothetical protein
MEKKGRVALMQYTLVYRDQRRLNALVQVWDLNADREPAIVALRTLLKDLNDGRGAPVHFEGPIASRRTPVERCAEAGTVLVLDRRASVPRGWTSTMLQSLLRRRRSIGHPGQRSDGTGKCDFPVPSSSTAYAR